MRDALKGAFVGAFLLALLGAIATRAGWIEVSLPRPQGTGAWMLSRATGLLAYIALSVDAIVGLLVSTRSADRFLPRGQLVDLHRWISPVMLALVFAHGGVLLADNYARFDVIDLVIPFTSRRWPIPVGLGVLAGYVVFVVHLSFGLRKRLGAVLWRRIHYLSFAAFVLVTVHATTAGTDRGHPWFASVYVTMPLVIALLVMLRIKRASERQKPSGDL